MNCMDRDQDLLLLVHGELKAVKRLALARHLQGCPLCRERHSQFASASRQVAAVVHGSRIPLWPRRAGPGTLRGSRRLTYLGAMLVLSGIGLAVSEMRIHAASRAANLAACSEPRPGPCRPDLPNDLCR